MVDWLLSWLCVWLDHRWIGDEGMWIRSRDRQTDHRFEVCARCGHWRKVYRVALTDQDWR